MDTAFFAPWTQLVSGLFVGICFGFILRKAYVTRFPVIVGQLLLKDFTVMKVMMTAIALGSVGIHLLSGSSLLIDPSSIKAALIGGAIFGIGMATLGFCPGTGVGALADGARDMWFGLLGMIVGAGIFAEISDWFNFGPGNEATLDQTLGLSGWIIILCLLAIILALTRIKDK